jgi:hypothetical protein
MKLSISRLPWVAFILFAGFLAIALVRHYSDVPFWDMWDGYLDFYNRTLSRDFSAWWYQHNEHRIILSRLLFWMDIAWFGGKSVFLIIVNFMLAISAALFLSWIFKEAFKGQEYSCVHWLLYTLCLTLPLSWIQQENLVWAFQSQFFLAQLLPLAAFYCFYLSEQRQSWGWFWTSLAVGVASAGTMANGVIVLLLLVLVALIASEARLRKTLFYAVSAWVVLTLYFFDYQSPQGHGSMADTIIEHPVGMLKYTALYIGSPIHILLSEVSPGSLDMPILYFSMASGFFLMFCSLAILVLVLRHPKVHILEIALLGFIAYIGATAFGTAGGRLMFGLEQALAGRYRTPAILLWLCFLILLLRFYPSHAEAKSTRIITKVGLSVTLLLLVIPQLSGAMSDNRGAEYERNVAVLAMSLGIRDEGQIGHVYPWIDHGMKIASESVASEISVFSEDERFYRLNQSLEREVLPSSDDVESIDRCEGSIDELIPIAGNAQYLKIRGWLHESDAITNRPLSMTLPNGEPIGYLIKGKERPDVAEAVSEEARYSGYYGYLLQEKLSDSNRLFVRSENQPCWFDLAFTNAP